MNPGRVSVQRMFENKADYRCIDTFDHGGGWVNCVFEHLETGTYWEGGYAIRRDDNDSTLPCSWRQVWPKLVTKTVWVTEPQLTVVRGEIK